MATFISIIVFVMLLTINVEMTNAEANITGIVLQPKYEVRIVNDIRVEKASPMTIHCASGDNDLGFHTLTLSQEFHWVFRQNVLPNTRFFCHFWWGKKQRAFDVFYDGWSENCEHPKGTNDRNLCKWVARVDGFYFTNKFVYDPLMERKYTWR